MMWGSLKEESTIFLILMAILTPNAFAASGDDIRITLHDNELHDDVAAADDYTGSMFSAAGYDDATVNALNASAILRFDGNADTDLKDSPEDYDLYNAIVIIDQANGDIQFAYNLTEHSTFSNGDGNIDAGEVVTIKGDKYVVTDNNTVDQNIELGPAITKSLTADVLDKDNAVVVSGTKKILYDTGGYLRFYDAGSQVESPLDTSAINGSLPYKLTSSDITSDEFKPYHIYVLSADGSSAKVTFVEKSQLVSITNDEEGVFGYSSIKVGDSEWFTGGTTGVYFLSDPIYLVKNETIDLPDTYYQLKYTSAKQFDILRKKQYVVADVTELKDYTSPGMYFLTDNIHLTIVIGGINVSWATGSEVVVDGTELKTTTSPGSNFLAEDIWLKILEKPDLTISPYDISFSDYTPKQGDSIQIYAETRNLEKPTTESFYLRFYANGGLIGQVLAYENQTVSVTWTPTSGTYEIKVVADENNAISESNETNNFATKDIYVRLGDISIEIGSDELHDDSTAEDDYTKATLATYYNDATVHALNASAVLRFDGNADDDLMDDPDDYDLYNAIVIIDQANGDIQFAYNLTEHSTFSNGDGNIDAGEVVTIKGDKYVVTDNETSDEDIELGPAITKSLTADVLDKDNAVVVSGTKKILYDTGGYLRFYDAGSQVESPLDTSAINGSLPYKLTSSDITSDEFKPYHIYVLSADGSSAKVTLVEKSQVVTISNDQDGALGYSSVKINDSSWFTGGTTGVFFLSDPITLVKGESIDLPDTYYQLKYTASKEFDILRKKTYTVPSGTELKTTTEPGEDFLKEAVTLSIVGSDVSVEFRSAELHDTSGVDYPKEPLSTTYGVEGVYPIGNNPTLTLRFDGNADGDLKDTEDYDLYNAIVIIDSIAGDIQFAYNLSAAEHSTYSDGNGEIDAGEVVTIKGDKYVITDNETSDNDIELGPAITKSLNATTVNEANATVVSGTKKILYGNDGRLYFYDAGSVVDNVSLSGISSYPYMLTSSDITSDEFKPYKIYVVSADGTTAKVTLVEKSQLVKLSNDEEGVMGYSSVKVGDTDWFANGTTGVYFLSDPISLVKGESIDLPDTYYQLKYTSSKQFDILRKKMSTVASGTKLKTTTEPGKDFLVKDITVTAIISVNTPPPPSGGGGGGGPPPAEDKETEGIVVTPTEADVVVQVDAAFSSIPEDKTGTISILEIEDMPLTEIAIKVENKVSNVEIAVKTLTSKPAEITPEIAGEVLRYLKIDHENIEDDDIETVTIKFKVEKTWIKENNIDAAKVVLNRFRDDKWNALTTTKESEDGQYVHYSAEAPGLSVFAISGSILVPTPTETLALTETPPTSAPTTTAPPTTPAPTPAPIPFVKVGIVLLLVAAGAYVFVKRKKV